jgi:hypothetical protein
MVAIVELQESAIHSSQGVGIDLVCSRNKPLTSGKGHARTNQECGSIVALLPYLVALQLDDMSRDLQTHIL